MATAEAETDVALTHRNVNNKPPTDESPLSEEDTETVVQKNIEKIRSAAKETFDDASGTLKRIMNQARNVRPQIPCFASFSDGCEKLDCLEKDLEWSERRRVSEPDGVRE